MKKNALILLLLLTCTTVFAQQKVYNPELNAMEQIDHAIATAQQQHKYVLCQVGGNWCPWCLRFAQYATKDSVVSKIIEREFVYIHVNYSKENKNPEAMKRLNNPARFGFPVFVILDEQGNVLHIQNSAYLEENKGYSQQKVADFLLNWTHTAVETLK